MAHNRAFTSGFKLPTFNGTEPIPLQPTYAHAPVDNDETIVRDLDFDTPNPFAGIPAAKDPSVKQLQNLLAKRVAERQYVEHGDADMPNQRTNAPRVRRRVATLNSEDARPSKKQKTSHSVEDMNATDTITSIEVPSKSSSPVQVPSNDSSRASTPAPTAMPQVTVGNPAIINGSLVIHVDDPNEYPHLQAQLDNPKPINDAPPSEPVVAANPVYRKERSTTTEKLKRRGVQLDVDLHYAEQNASKKFQLAQIEADSKIAVAETKRQGTRMVKKISAIDVVDNAKKRLENQVSKKKGAESVNAFLKNERPKMVKEKEQILKDNKIEVDGLRKEIAELKGLINVMEAPQASESFKLMQTKVKQLMNQLEKLNIANLKLQESSEADKRLLTLWQEERIGLKQAQTELVEANRQLNEKNTEIIALKAEIAGMQKKMDSFVQKHSKATGKEGYVSLATYNELQNEYTALQSKIENMDTSLGLTEKLELTSLRNNQEKMYSLMKKWTKTEAKTNGELIAAMQNKIKELEQQSNAAAATTVTTETTDADGDVITTGTVNALQHEIENLRSTLKYAQEQQDSLSKALASERKQSAHYEQSYLDFLEARTDSKLKETDAETKMSKAMSTATGKQMSELLAKNMDLQSKLSEANDMIGTIMNRIKEGYLPSLTDQGKIGFQPNQIIQINNKLNETLLSQNQFIEVLKNQNTQYMKELDMIRKSASNVTGFTTEVNNQIFRQSQLKDSEVRSLTAKNLELNQQNLSLSVKLADAQKEYDANKFKITDYNKYSSENVKLKEQVANLEKNIAENKHRVEIYQKNKDEIERLEKELQKMTSKYEDNKHKIEAYATNEQLIVKQRQELIDLKDDLAKVNTLQAEIMAKYKENVENVKFFKSQKTTDDAYISTLSKDLSAANTEIQSLVLQVNKANKEYNQANAAADLSATSVEMVKQRDAEITQLKKRIFDAGMELAEAAGKVANIPGLESTIKQLRTENQAHHDKIASLSKQVAELEGTSQSVSKLQTDLVSSRVNERTLSQQLATAQGTINANTVELQQLVQLRERNTVLNNEVVAARQMATKHNELVLKVSELAGQLQTKSEQYEALLRQQQINVQTGENSLQAAQRLRQQLQDREAEIVRITAERTTLQNQRTALEQQLVTQVARNNEAALTTQGLLFRIAERIAPGGPLTPLQRVALIGLGFAVASAGLVIVTVTLFRQIQQFLSSKK